MAVQTFFTIVQIFSPSWTVFSILFFMSGLGQISNYISGFVLGKCLNILYLSNIKYYFYTVVSVFE